MAEAKAFMLGNEAVARGAVEAGVGVASGYPGTPSSEILDTLARWSKDVGIEVEYSTNEIVAVEVAAGAALCGVRSICTMKHVGLNVASDALMTLAYTGVKAGMIIVTADDPNCYSSQNEQDNRYYALFANLPMLEPSNPQEAKDMVLYGLELSERLELPVLLRLVTRVAHARAIVKLKEVVKPNLMGSFVKNPRRFVPLPAHARIQHRTLIEKMEKAEQLAEASPFNFVEGKGRFGIVTAGISYAYTKDALRIMNVDASILKLGFIHPLPEALVADFVRKLDGVAVIEELEPILESQVKNVCFDHRVDVKVWGKRQGYFPRFGEFSIRTVLLGLSKILDKPLPINFDKIDFTSKSNEELSPPRPPILCPGCPHTATLYAIKMATGGRGVYPTDIGCYTLGVNPPLQVGDALLCMGSSVGLSNGMSIVLKEPVVAVVGDSTFFHASIPGLINAVYNNRKFVYVVLDNLTTAMTGFQPHPGTGSKACGDEGRRVLIEDVAKGCGVKFVEVVDPYDIQKTISAIKRALQHDGPSVIVARRACVAFKRPDSQPFQILPELCKFKMHQRGEAVKACMVCVRSLGCPSLLTVDDRLMIDESTCTGCGVCAQLCPFGAIIKKSG